VSDDYKKATHWTCRAQPSAKKSSAAGAKKGVMDANSGGAKPWAGGGRLTTAFPKIPPADVAWNPRGGHTAREKAPPALPFDVLVRAAEHRAQDAEVGEAERETRARDARTRARCAALAPTLDDEDARQFLQALVFLGTLGR
jgi:hypothetical protein